MMWAHIDVHETDDNDDNGDASPLSEHTYRRCMMATNGDRADTHTTNETPPARWIRHADDLPDGLRETLDVFELADNVCQTLTRALNLARTTGDTEALARALGVMHEDLTDWMEGDDTETSSQAPWNVADAIGAWRTLSGKVPHMLDALCSLRGDEDYEVDGYEAWVLGAMIRECQEALDRMMPPDTSYPTFGHDDDVDDTEGL